MYIYIYIHIHTYIHTYIHIYIICTCIYIYIYIYIYVYIYIFVYRERYTTHIYIYIYICIIICILYVTDGPASPHRTSAAHHEAAPGFHPRRPTHGTKTYITLYTMCIYIYIYVYVHTYIYIYIYVYLYVYTCMERAPIYHTVYLMCTTIYIYIYIYIHTAMLLNQHNCCPSAAQASYCSGFALDELLSKLERVEIHVDGPLRREVNLCRPDGARSNFQKFDSNVRSRIRTCEAHDVTSVVRLRLRARIANMLLVCRRMKGAAV